MDSPGGIDRKLVGHRELSSVHGDELVGRATELATLHARLTDAQDGSGHAVLVEGVAGVGKSRLLAELAVHARERGFQVLDARAIQPEHGAPFAVALQLFEPTLARMGPSATLFEGAAELARPLFSGEYDSITAQSPFPLQHGLFWLAVGLAQRAPLLMCVDDAQWCDEGSVGFVRYLARRVADLPVLLIVAARLGASHSSDPLLAVRESWSGDRMRLATLTADNVRSLVRRQAPQADDAFCAVCVELSGGNPFYVREILHAARDHGLDPTVADAPHLREVAFASITRASLARLSRLGLGPVAVARALAILGDGSSIRHVGIVAGLDRNACADAVDALVADKLLVRAAGLSFAHPLIGELVGEEMSFGDRAAAHAGAARLLAGEGASPEAVAEHVVLSAADADPWVVEVLRTAARRACGAGLPASAIRLLSRALEEPPASADRAAVLAELGRAESACCLPAGIEHLRAALESHPGPAARQAIRRDLARALATQGRRREAAVILESVLDDAAGGDSIVPALTEYLVNAAFEPGMRQHAIARSAGLLTAAPSGDTPAERELLAVMAMRSGQDCEPSSATVALADRAWSNGALLAEHGPDHPGWLMTVWALDLALDHRRGEEVALAAVETARSAGSIEAFATASYFCAWARSALGRIVEAQADLAQAVDARQHGWRRYLVAALSRQTSLHVLRGDLNSAQASLALAFDVDPGGGMELPWRLQAVGDLALARHDAREALRCYLEAGAWLAENLQVEYTVLTWRTDAARAALLLGEREHAAELLRHEARLAARSGAPGHLGRVGRVQALLTGGDEGVELLRRSCVQLAAAGHTVERAEALIDLGSALRRSGVRAEARPHLFEALDILTRAGADAPAARAREELLASGARRRREPTSGAASLTPSELRVAQLAAEGLTNTQVAQALFVTPKTIEYHLRNVFQKLSIGSRGELRAALAAATPSD